MAKDFKSPALQFLTGEQAAEGKDETAAETAEATAAQKAEKPARARKVKAPDLQTVPKGYRIDHRYVEVKSRRVQLVFQPSLYDRVKALADEKGMSFNECVHQLLELSLNGAKE